MNIFVLDNDPGRAAADHCDKHLIKMILESGTMLCTAHWLGWARMLNAPPLKPRQLQQWLFDNVPKDLQPPWKMSHVHHPCTQWTQRVWGNYMWHSRLGLALCAEYTKRYGKVHKSHEVHRWLNRMIPPTFEGRVDDPVGITPFALAMPEDCKVPDDAVQSYRNYYNKHKVRIAKWKYSAQPTWWNPTENQ
jgi:hypothetical protein